MTGLWPWRTSSVIGGVISPRISPGTHCISCWSLPLLPSTSLKPGTYHVKFNTKFLHKTFKKSSPITDLDRPWGFQEVEAPRFQDSWHMKVVRLSAVHTGRLYSSGNIPSTHFCYGCVDPRAIIRAEGLYQWKNSSDTIGNRTHKPPACNAVPEPTVPPYPTQNLQRKHRNAYPSWGHPTNSESPEETQDCLSILRTPYPTQNLQWKHRNAYPSWGHPTQLRISRGSTGLLIHSEDTLPNSESP